MEKIEIIEHDKIDGFSRIEFRVGDELMAHFKSTHNLSYEFYVYSIFNWERSGTGEKGFRYVMKECEQDSLDTFDKDKALKKMEGSFCWRGVWEGRLHFTDDEYWGEEIADMSTVYNDILVPYFKDLIMKSQPDYSYD